MSSENWRGADGWERGFWVLAWLLALVLAVGAVAKVFGLVGGGEDGAPASEVLGVSSPSEAGNDGLVGEPPALSRPAQPLPAQPPPLPAEEVEPAIRDCDRLRRSGFDSPSERAWFLAYCPSSPAGASALSEVLSAPSEAAGTGAAPYVPPVVPPSVQPTPPPAPPEPEPAPATEADAIALAVRWLRTEAPVAYGADAGACDAVLMNSWIVTCRATLLGCPEEGCLRTVTVCVDAQATTVSVPPDC